MAIGIEPYQVVPPLGEKKNQISVAPAVVVRVSAAAPPGKLNVPPAQATDLPAVASFVSISVNEVAVFAVVVLGADNVNVQLPVSVDVNTLPAVQVMVVDVPELPSAETLSAQTLERKPALSKVSADPVANALDDEA